MLIQKALVGHSGYVGSTLQRQTQFDAMYRSTDIANVRNRDFDLVVCAGAPAQKWLANKAPEADKARIADLIGHLDSTGSCKRFVLISTVDVFSRPLEVSESSAVDSDELNAYGLHRRELELFVQRRFENALIVRLPGLVGPGLRKNAIYDLLNDNNVEAIDSRGVFQFYPMVNLWADINLALRHDLPLLHLTAQPLAIEEIAREVFNRNLPRVHQNAPAVYDFRSEHTQLFGGQENYQYSAKESLLAIRAYAQSEPRAASERRAS